MSDRSTIDAMVFDPASIDAETAELNSKMVQRKLCFIRQFLRSRHFAAVRRPSRDAAGPVYGRNPGSTD